MDESIPIQIYTKGLFEKGDVSSGRLLQKLEAWLNFQTLLANWYQDESLVIKIKLCLMPENVFYEHKLDENLNWESFKDKSITGVYYHDQTNTEFESYIMLPKADLNEIMNHPEKVEQYFQIKLGSAANEMGGIYDYAQI